MRSFQLRRRRTALVAVALLIAFVFSGCHTVTRIALPDSTPPPADAVVFTQLKAGDDVRVTLRTGEKVTFALAEVQTEGLVAKDGRHIAFRDVGQIERQRVSKGRSLGLALGICAAAFGALILVLSHAPIPVA